jgi:tryptophanyl-tRNA synthetase
VRQRVFSGIQPSGQLTIGNYLGAMRQFVDLQDTADAYYCIVDLHAITLPQDPRQLRERTADLAALYLAIGLRPDACTLFVQSDVAAHSELTWILQCTSYMGELSRMIQYKEKAEGRESVPTGLFVYPTLMAADILLYQSHAVPVGEDQKQHLELTRDLAERFNSRFGETFVIPEVLMMKEGARIMSLDDPTKKMSKSNPNPASRIELLDTPDDIVKKCTRAVTDSGREVRYDPVEKPAISNLLTIYSGCASVTVQQAEETFAGKGYGDFKRAVAEAVVGVLEPIQARFREIRTSGELEQILQSGAERAAHVANATLAQVRDRVGLGVARR